MEKGCMILKINEDQGKKQKGMHDGKSNKQKNLEQKGGSSKRAKGGTPIGEGEATPFTDQNSRNTTGAAAN